MCAGVGGARSGAASIEGFCCRPAGSSIWPLQVSLASVEITGVERHKQQTRRFRYRQQLCLPATRYRSGSTLLQCVNATIGAFTIPPKLGGSPDLELFAERHRLIAAPSPRSGLISLRHGHRHPALFARGLRRSPQPPERAATTDQSSNITTNTGSSGNTRRSDGVSSCQTHQPRIHSIFSKTERINKRVSARWN